MKAVLCNAFTGPEDLRIGEFEEPKPASDEIARYWNAFGTFDPSRAGQLITVELNIPIDQNGEQVAGFFARETLTKKIYLMHTGKVGGGAKGIGKNAFLTWSRNQPIPAFDRVSGAQRFGMVIGSFDQNSLLGRIGQFVKQVASFKEFVRQGRHDTPEFRKRVEQFERFRPEFSGRKTGYNGGTIDYLSYHGDVIGELHRKRSEAKSPTEVVFNTGLIDLAVRDGNVLTELYEAKTSTERQHLTRQSDNCSCTPQAKGRRGSFWLFRRARLFLKMCGPLFANSILRY